MMAMDLPVQHISRTAAAGSDGEVLVRAAGLGKKFCRNLRQSLWYGMQDLVAELAPWGRGGNSGMDSALRSGEFWAVDDVSFELRRGECLGLIGRNGAGKTTLLKMLNGLIRPDRGRIEIHGRVGALIALGAGFNPILTGRENVYVNAAVLGLSKKEVDAKFEEIVEFAELAEFIDAPVQSYSSGMQVRLGFAIAAHLQPDVLLVDEVLAVGDVGFRIKCFNRLFEIGRNTAIVVVSHSMQQVARLSSHILLLGSGRLQYFGNELEKGIQRYLDLFPVEPVAIHGGEDVQLLEIRVLTAVPERATSPPGVRYGDDLVVQLRFKVSAVVGPYSIDLGFSDQEGRTVAKSFSRVSRADFDNAGEAAGVELTIPALPFASGVYSVNVTFTAGSTDRHSGRVLAQFRTAASFRVMDNLTAMHVPVQLKGDWRVLP
jgi:lipopolysaccharide transport system ATP-binding protein